jgi:hypothetical protein
MDSANVEAITRTYEAVQKGDLETLHEQLSELLSPQFVIGERIVPEAAPHKEGPDALVANADHFAEVFGDVHWRALEILDLEDRVLVRVHVEGTAGHTALQIDEDIGHLFTMENGLATRLDIYRTWREARAAAGLRD